MVLAARLEARGSADDQTRLTSRGTPRVDLDVGAGHAWICSDADGGTLRGDGIIAGWDHAIAEPLGASLDELRAARAGALVVASRAGLCLERGPYGGRPLYYCQDSSGVSVSSSLATLVRSRAQRPPLDVERLGAVGTTRVGPDPRATIYAGVRRVLPCETVRLTLEGPAKSTFRIPRVPERSRGTPADHARMIREMLESIVARELTGRSAVAVQTGGGVDSSGIFALVANHARQNASPRFIALAMDFAGPGDDRPHLRALLRHLDARALRVSPREVARVPLEMFEQDAAPYTMPTGPMGELLVQRAKAWGAEAILSGFAGDAVLDGDLDSFAARVRAGDLGAIADAARLTVPWTLSRSAQLGQLIVKPLVLPWLPQSLIESRRSHWFTRQEVSRWAGPRLRPLLVEPVNPDREGDEWLTAFATSQAMMESADGVGRAEATWGIPQINPYVDPRFVELVSSIPPEQLFVGDQMRGLFRLAMKGVLPESLRLRNDKASFEPMFDAMFAAAGGLDAFQSLLTMEVTADLGLVEPSAFRETVARVVRRERTARGWLEFWPMLAVEAFLRGLSTSRCADDIRASSSEVESRASAAA